MTVTTDWRWRIALPGLAFILLQVAGGAALPRQAVAQSNEGTVQIEPTLSVVSWASERFTVFVTAEDLRHRGSISYDDDGDDIPDRSVPSNGLGAFELRLGYDPKVLAVERVEPGPGITGARRAFQCLQRGDPGLFSFGCVSAGATPDGPEGDLTLASYTFALAGGGATWLTLDAQLAGPLGDSINVQVDGGAARVTGAPSPSPTTGPGRTPNPPDGGPTPTPPRPEQTPDGSEPPGVLTPAQATSASTTPGPGGSSTPGAPTAAETPGQGRTAGETAGPANGATGNSAGTGGTGSGRSAAQIALWSLGAAGGLSVAGLGAFWLAGRLARRRYPPAGPWP